MIGRNDDGTIFTLDNAFNVGAFAAQHGLSSLSFWSLNRDNPSNLDYVGSKSSSNPEQRVTGEYTRSFLAGALNVLLPTLPDVVQLVDAQMKTQPLDIASSPHWRAKKIGAAVASALPPPLPPWRNRHAASKPQPSRPLTRLTPRIPLPLPNRTIFATQAAAVGSAAAQGGQPGALPTVSPKAFAPLQPIQWSMAKSKLKLTSSPQQTLTPLLTLKLSPLRTPTSWLKLTPPRCRRSGNKSRNRSRSDGVLTRYAAAQGSTPARS
ncbi:MAG: hypothetical protein ACR5LG_01950 [Sodalis sp. (in: enterobacteria)]|uniref:hypothetical protein n=1 Tax=Sodalis sp. (in: enterobacteria) TaxID=1898979 RepID=UPI003F3DB81A